MKPRFSNDGVDPRANDPRPLAPSQPMAPDEFVPWAQPDPPPSRYFGDGGRSRYFGPRAREFNHGIRARDIEAITVDPDQLRAALLDELRDRREWPR